MTYLGLDYGLKHIGVAISDGGLAEPLTTISTAQAFDLLPGLVTRHNITTIIVGIPDGPVKKSAQHFLEAISFLPVTIFASDETLSSQDAVVALHHTTQTRRQQKVHAVAATIILQNWLDSHSPAV
jgi:putative holliday junction resolvase